MSTKKLYALTDREAMDPYYQDEHVTLHHGDALNVLATLPDNSVEAVVTDPPYGLANTTPTQVAETLSRWTTGDRNYTPAGRGFMGHEWDAFVPPPAVWDECYRVLKPGGHLAVFAGSRTQDLMGLSVRLAGFDVRDSVAWLYGSGFPKSMDVSKAIDKVRDDLDDVHAVVDFLRANLPKKPEWGAIDAACGSVNTRQKFFTRSTKGMKSRCPTWDQWGTLKALLGLPDDMDAEVWRLNGRKGTPGENWDKREVIGTRKTGIGTGKGGTPFIGDSDNKDVTTAATDEAKKWSGWGTALKPAHEPILLARKPLAEKTVAANVTTWGTGALNIDATRIAHQTINGGNLADNPHLRETINGGNGGSIFPAETDRRVVIPNAAGRWPANVVLDECAAHELDQQSGIQRDGVAVNRNKNTAAYQPHTVYGDRRNATTEDKSYGSGGGASRFFYVAKAPKRERPNIDGVAHPTVKPLALMRWLVRLLTPPGGVVLDPFAGSGTTLLAAVDENHHVIGVELEERYCKIIAKRLTQDALDPGI